MSDKNPMHIPGDVMSAMHKMAEAIADRAEQSAKGMKAVPGDVALQSFADAIRRTNRENFPTLYAQ